MMHNFVLFLWKFDLEALKFFSRLCQYLNPNVGLGACQSGLKWERNIVRLVSSGLSWLDVQCARSSRGWGEWKHICSLPTHAQAQLLPDTCLQPWADQLCKKGRDRDSSSWKRDSCCLSHHGNWGACPLLQMPSILQMLQSSQQRPAGSLKPHKNPQKMFFPLSAASKAQVSQIYFPRKLFLHN